MPTAPYASVRATVNGGATQTGGITAAAGNVIQLSADPAGLAGATQYRWELLDFPTAFTVPAGWTTDANGFHVSTLQTPPPFTLATGTANWGKYIVRLKLNGGGPSATGRETAAQLTAIASLTDTTFAISVASVDGLLDLAYYEGTQFGGIKGWVKDFKASLRIIQGLITSAGGGVAVGSHGALLNITADDHVMYARVSGARAWTANQSLGGFKLTSLGTPTLATDATTKSYVDNAAISSASLFNVLTYGASAAASAATNTTAFLAAITAAKAVRGTVVVPEGTYALNAFAVTGGATFNIELRTGATLDFTGATVPSATFCITIGQEADYVSLGTLGAHFNKYDSTVTFSVAPSLGAEELFIVYNNDDFSWDAGDPTRPYYKKGDFCRVRSRAGVVVTTDSPAYDTYLTSENTNTMKLLTNTVRIFGGGQILVPDNVGVTSGGIGIWNGYKCRVDDLIANGAKWAHVGLYRCYESEIRRLSICNYADATVERNYGVIMLSCYACHVRDSWIRVARHCVTITGGSVVGTHPNRLCSVDGGTYRSDLIALDMHGSAEWCSFQNLSCDGGMNVAGDHWSVSNCVVLDCPHPTDFRGVALRVREDKGTNGSIQDVTLVARYVAIGANSLLCLLYGAPVRGGTVSVKNLRLITASLAISQVAQIDLGGSSAGRVSVDIDGITCVSELDAAPQFSVTCASAAKFDQVSIRNTKGVSPRFVGSARLVTVDGVEVFGAAAAGVLTQFVAWPGGGQQQRADIKNVTAMRCSTLGINVSAALVTDDVIVSITGNTSVNNGTGGGSSSGRASVGLTNVKQASVLRNTLGDSQTVQTEAFSCSVAGCGTVSIWDNKQEGVQLVDSIGTTTTLLTSQDMVAHIASEDVLSAAQTAVLDIPVLAGTTVKYRVDVEAEDASGYRASVLAIVRVTRSGSGTPPTPNLTVLQTTGSTITLAATISGTSLRLRTTNTGGADAHITTQVREESRILTVEDS